MPHRESTHPVHTHPVLIKGTILLADGSATEFSINPDLGWQQWGNDTDHLGATVDLLGDLANACAEHFLPEAREED